MTNSNHTTPKRQSIHRRFTPTVQPSDEKSTVPSDTQSDQSQNDTAYDSQSFNGSQFDPATSSDLPYVPIAPFPTFLGGSEECPDAHISRFTKVCRANNAATNDAMARIFPVTLDGEASLWYDLNIEPYDNLTWDDIKTSFLDAFGSPEVPTETLLSELAAIRQGDEESVRSYLLRMQGIMRKLKGFDLNEKMVREIFVGGLRGEFGDLVGLGLGKEGSLSEAVRLALRDGKKKKQSQCQCWKHQCWKKNGIERNFSGVSHNLKGD